MEDPAGDVFLDLLRESPCHRGGQTHMVGVTF